MNESNMMSVLLIQIASLILNYLSVVPKGRLPVSTAEI